MKLSLIPFPQMFVNSYVNLVETEFVLQTLPVGFKVRKFCL